MFCRKDIEDEESDSENYQSEIENYCKDIDSYYWTEIEKINKECKHQILQEKTPYLLGTDYVTADCSPLSIHCGLSIARCFEPSVKLMKKSEIGTQITFSADEWELFIFALRCLDISYLSDNEVPCITTSKEEDIKHIECDEDVKICKTSTLDCKILKVYTRRESINYHILSEEEEDNSLICSESIESTPSPEAPASTAPGPSTTTTTTTTTTKNIQQKQSCHCNKREKASALPNQPTKNITIQVHYNDKGELLYKTIKFKTTCNCEKNK
ncbi:unnamed protein product [Acanthoscelides obtectus]|uniref:Uncharacterized protein n=1 Tax=Acanthoscelides obtectus TaxID=200917 RepID=A0A9P0VNL6_ACAOB|nr:unnamed protein product [Acanthoscelides obtectus]CAK1687480.1 hypothetical protein AOBTE_LOCUS36263 [Acanthoscelides obtectus]